MPGGSAARPLPALAGLLLAACASPAAEPPMTELAGTTWRIEMVRGMMTTGDRPAEISFAENGQIAGSTGCNRFTGAALDGMALRASPALATTRMACPPPLAEQESAVLAALQGGGRFVAESDALVLVDERGTVQMRLVQAAP
jgi:heat shock protein HslJ